MKKNKGEMNTKKGRLQICCLYYMFKREIERENV